MITFPRIICCVNQKGGAAKTTLTAQLAYALSELHEKRVLAVDMDPQANLTQALGQADTETEFCSHAILEPKEIFGTVFVNPYLSLIPSHIELARMEKYVARLDDYQFLLQKAFKKSLSTLFPDGLDYVLIDSPPHLGALTVNVLMASHEVLIPVTCDRFGLNGVSALLDTIEVVRGMNHEDLSVLGVVASRVDVRRKIDQETLQYLKETFGPLLFKARIPESTALKDVSAQGVSIWQGRSGSLAASSMAELCLEVMSRGRVPATLEAAHG